MTAKFMPQRQALLDGSRVYGSEMLLPGRCRRPPLKLRGPAVPSLILMEDPAAQTLRTLSGCGKDAYSKANDQLARGAGKPFIHLCRGNPDAPGAVRVGLAGKWQIPAVEGYGYRPVTATAYALADRHLLATSSASPDLEHRTTNARLLQGRRSLPDLEQCDEIGDEPDCGLGDIDATRPCPPLTGQYVRIGVVGRGAPARPRHGPACSSLC
jgi:hypothetical protein